MIISKVLKDVRRRIPKEGKVVVPKILARLLCLRTCSFYSVNKSDTAEDSSHPSNPPVHSQCMRYITTVEVESRNRRIKMNRDRAEQPSMN